MSSTPKTRVKEAEPDRAQNIQVFVRCRPLNHQEKAGRSIVAVEIGGQKEVLVKGTPLNSLTKTYQFDRAFGPSSSQCDVYSSVVAPLIDQVLQGYNCTVFAYGQTGTGKTFTMEGGGENKTDSKFDWETDPKSGIIPRALSQIFDDLRSTIDTEFSVRISFLELYNEEIFDLLSPAEDLSKLRLYEDATKRGSVIIQGLEEIQVHNKKQVFQILDKGSQKRKTAETLMNATSSRSHTVFTVTIHIKESSLEGEEVLRIGKLNLVDLAGSENIGRSGAVAGRAREAGNINQSLLTLGRVITCLVERSPHIPYRESKLTRLLQDSLGGRTKTSIIATISPATINLEETLSTLDYAHRAKNITNRPELNQKLSQRTVLKEYTEEIERLRKELFNVREQQGVYIALENYQQMMTEIQSQQKEIVEKLGEMRALKEEMDRKTKSFLECEEQLKANREQLERSKEQLGEQEQVLSATRVVLHKTIQEKELQQHLVTKHVETEVKLSQQARKLLVVCDDSNRDVAALHDKLERTRNLKEENEAAKTTFQACLNASLDRLLGGLAAYEEAHAAGCRQLSGRVGEGLAEGLTALGRLSTMVEAVKTVGQTGLGHLHQAIQENGDDSKRRQEERIVAQSAASARVVAADQQLEQQMVGPALATLATQLAQQSAALRSLESAAIQDVRDLRGLLLQAGEDLAAHITHLRTVVEEKVTESQTITHRMHTLNTTTTASFDMVKAALDTLMATYDRHSNLVAENVGGQQDLQRDLGRTLSTLTGEASAASHRHQCDQAAYADKIVEDSSRRLEVHATTLSTCQDSNETSGELVNNLSTSVNTSLENKLKTLAQLRLESEAWVGQMNEKSNAANAHIGAFTQQMSSKLEEDRIAVQAAVEAASVSGSQHSRHLEAVLMADISAPTVNFCASDTAEVKQVLEEVEEFVAVHLREDQPSGSTPARMERSYPRYLAATSPHVRIIDRYQRQTGSLRQAAELPLDDTADSDSVFSRSTVLGGLSRGSEADLARLSSSSVGSSMLTDYHTDENVEPADEPPSGMEKRSLKQPRPAYRGREVLSSLHTNK